MRFIYRPNTGYMADTVSDTSQSPIEYFRLKAALSGSHASIGNMTRAIDSLYRFAGGVDLSFSGFDEPFLGEWVARQFFDGYYARTVAYNVSKIAALYNKAVAENLASPTDAFATVISKIKDAGSRFDGIDHADTFTRLRKICHTEYPAGSTSRLARDIVLFGILNGGMTLSQIASFKKDDLDSSDALLSGIAADYARPKNKYLFPLNQSRLTPRQLSQSVEKLVASVLAIPRKRQPQVADRILTHLWCDLAMSCGMPASDIAACVSDACASNPLTFCAVPAKLDPDGIAAVRKRVGETLADNPVRWYAMHLRRKVDFKTLADRLEDKKIKLDEVFYPMEEILRKVGKKKVFENRPVISWLIFYRARATQLGRLFHEVGDLAWGYRYLRDVRSPYAVIGDSEIREYQRAIGTLTPSTPILPDNELQFKKGDYLVILGGPMNGRHGVFIAEKKDKGEASGRVVFRISLAGGNNVNWEVNWDPRLVKKITESQYKELDTQLRKSLDDSLSE